MTKILSLIISFLLTVFPWSSYLQSQSQQLAFPGEKAACKMIAEYIKDNDVESIYNLYSEADKMYNENLREQIQNIIDSIDGKIIKTERGAGVGHQSDYANMGVYQSQRDFALEIKTTTEKYELLIFWITVDTEKPETVGLGALNLFDSNNELVAYASYNY